MEQTHIHTICLLKKEKYWKWMYQREERIKICEMQETYLQRNISWIKFVYFLEIEDGIIQPFMVKLKVYLMIIRKSGSWRKCPGELVNDQFHEPRGYYHKICWELQREQINKVWGAWIHGSWARIWEEGLARFRTKAAV